MKKTVLDSLNEGLHAALKANDSVLLMGEDILDPYGGAFKVTRGCSTDFPGRVLAAPISEAGLAGVAAGMALRGLRPVLEIMFGDFTALLADQLINHITKFKWMYNNTVNLPLVIRTPMGGRRGYGPTHSQTLEKLFLGVPGLTVLVPCNIITNATITTPGGLLESVILNTDDPVLFVENKLQYLLPLLTVDDLPDLGIEVVEETPVKRNGYPTLRIRVKGAPAPVVTLSSYGYMAELARQALVKLAFEEEIFTELIIPAKLAPFDVDPLKQSLSQTGRLVLIEEGGRTLGWGAEVIARMVECEPRIDFSAVRVAALDLPVPAAPSLEKVVLPQLDDILTAVRKVVKNR